MNDTLSIADFAEVDYTSGEVNIALESTDTPLSVLLKENISNKGHITVCLSGGLDSQFSANLAKHYAQSANAVTFRYLWNGSVVNGQDVATAQKLCELLDLDHTIEDFDLQPTLNNLSEYMQHYRSLSPHISVQLAAIKSSMHIEGTVLMGGELPIVTRLSTGEYAIGTGNVYTGGSRIAFGVPTNFYFTHHAPFQFLHIHNGIDVIRDPFMLTASTMYAGLAHNIHTINSKNAVVIRDPGDALKNSTMQYKKMYYESIDSDFVFVTPLHKHTGFEMLNMHLASQTGNYDEFDTRYRHPQFKNAFNADWVSPTLIDPKLHVFRLTNTNMDETLVEQLDQKLNSEITVENPTPVNVYSFNW